MKKILIASVLFLLVLLESSWTFFPLTIIFLIALFASTKEEAVLIAAFLFGLLLDILTLRAWGISSLFFLIVLLLLFLYEKKFETSSALFIGIYSMLVVLVYFVIFTGQFLPIESFFAAVFATGFFLFFRKFFCHLSRFDRDLRIESHKLQ